MTMSDNNNISYEPFELMLERAVEADCGPIFIECSTLFFLRMRQVVHERGGDVYLIGDKYVISYGEGKKTPPIKVNTQLQGHSFLLRKP